MYNNFTFVLKLLYVYEIIVIIVMLYYCYEIKKMKINNLRVSLTVKNHQTGYLDW